MSLKVYAGKNQASRRYELSFFRAFASTLAAQFKDEGRNGVLLGHPRSLDNEYFQPDALLITSNCVIIIDFKNFDNATIRLPDEDGFNRFEWKSVSQNRETVVKGGASSNPFAQLQKQSRWMENVLEAAGADLPIQTCVLFQGDIRLEGGIPGKYQAFFSIATGFDYPNVLNDSINLASRRTFSNFDSLVSRFEVSEFKDYRAISPINLVVAASLAEASQRKQEAIDAEQMADLRLKEAEELYADAERQGRSVAEAQAQLQIARREAERAAIEAGETQKKFDAKRHELELSRQLTEQMKAEAVAQQSRARRAVVGLIALFFVVAAVVFGFVASGVQQAEQSNQAQEKQAKVAKQLQEDRAAGRACIPTAVAEEFVGSKDVCVTFTVRSVTESEKLVFVQEQYRGDFTALVMSKSIFSKDEATAQLKGNEIEVRGDIEEYKGDLQIKVFKSSQITVVD